MSAGGSGRQSVRTACLVGLATLVVALIGTACTGPDGDSSGPPGDNDGPLRAPGYGGGVSIKAPRGDGPWTGTFGSTRLCTVSPEVVPSIKAIRYDMSKTPLDLATYLRIVPGAPARTGEEEWTPILTRYGTPNTDAGSELAAGGTFSDPVGQGVDTLCDIDTSQDPYTQLVTVMRVGPGGARFDNIYVDYEYAGKEYTLTISWTNVACGTAINDTDYCDE